MSDVSLSATLDLLQVLVDQSLTVRQPGADEVTPRFIMLETVRTFALEQLVRHGELADARARHARYFLTTFTTAASEWQVAGPPQASLTWIESEHSNIRTALDTLLDADSAEAAARLAMAVGDFWFIRSHAGEGMSWLWRALKNSRAIEPRTRARALAWIAGLAGRALDTSALAEGGESVAYWTMHSDETADRAFAVQQLGVLVLLAGDYARAERILQ